MGKLTMVLEAVAVLGLVASGVGLVALGCVWAGLALCNLGGLVVVLTGDEDDEEE